MDDSGCRCVWPGVVNADGLRLRRRNLVAGRLLLRGLARQALDHGGRRPAQVGSAQPSGLEVGGDLAVPGQPVVQRHFNDLLESAHRARPRLRVALVQVDPSFQDSAADLRRWTASVSKRVDLVCWPESSGGTYECSLDRLSDAQRVFDLSREPNRGLRPWEKPDCELLFGGKTYRGDRECPERIYQSAILVDEQERIVGRYHKRHLMPFGEFVPGQSWLPGIDSLFSVSEAVARGDEATVLPMASEARLGVMLCYEDMMPDAARSLTRNSADVLVSLINGSAFTNRLTLIQHRVLAQLRAVECRRYFLRCAATGETCVISPLGRIEAQLPLETQGVLSAEVALLDGQSAWCRLGCAFPVGCLILLGGYLGLSWRRKRASASSTVPLVEPSSLQTC